MADALRVAVADDEPEVQELYERMLTALGHRVVLKASTGRELVEECARVKPDLVITDIAMPDMDGLDAAAAIYDERPTPIILVSGFQDPDLIARAEANHILAYLIKPIRKDELQPAIALVRRRFEEFQELTREANTVKKALEDRITIEKAKHVLMKQLKLDEPNAFRRLQKLASEQNRKLADIADMIVTASEAYG